MHSNKPTEVDSMNRLRVQAEDKAALYRRALELACFGDKGKVAFYLSDAEADGSKSRPDLGDPEGYAQRLCHLGRLSPEDMLKELLAVIHRDGGHYSDEHGLAKAVADAEAKWYARGVKVDRHQTFCAQPPMPSPMDSESEG